MPCWRRRLPGPMQHLPPATCSSRHCVVRSPALQLPARAGAHESAAADAVRRILREADARDRSARTHARGAGNRERSPGDRRDLVRHARATGTSPRVAQPAATRGGGPRTRSGACTCPDCGGALGHLGQDVDEMLDVLTVYWRVARNVRPKYSCRTCERIVKAAATVKAVARGKATFGTLEHGVVSKFEHHLLLYRQSEMMAAQSLDIDRSTRAGWVGQAAALLDLIVSRIGEDVLKGEDPCRRHASSRARPWPRTHRDRAAMGLCGRRPRLGHHDTASDMVSVHDRPHRCTFARSSCRI